MELKDFVGKHILQGVEFGSGVFVDYWGEHNKNYVDFRVDNVTYRASEDEDDGYRSYCEELIVVDSIPKIKLPDVEVIGTMMKDCEGEVNDVIIFIDAITGESVLEIGTRNTDGYYPCCWTEYHPENLSCNISR